MGKNTFILTEDLHVQDPHDVVLSLFESSNDEMVLAGTLKEFIKRSLLIILGLIAIRVLLENYFPGIVEIIMALVIGVFSIYFVTFFVKHLIPMILKIRLRLLIKATATISFLFIIGGIIGLC